jgi:hypothetical protein
MCFDLRCVDQYDKMRGRLQCLDGPYEYAAGLGEPLECIGWPEEAFGSSLIPFDGSIDDGPLQLIDLLGSFVSA